MKALLNFMIHSFGLQADAAEEVAKQFKEYLGAFQSDLNIKAAAE